MLRSLTLALASASLVGAPAAHAAPLFTGLGDLVGGSAYSSARDVSADGSTVVGVSLSANGQEAFRWTESTGMVGLGDLQDGLFGSVGGGVSGDGSVVVGHGSANEGIRAYRWTQAGGMTPLGVAPGGSLSVATGVSHDGSVLAGIGDGVALRWTSGTGMVALGDLPGGPSSSHANAISADGVVIVGQGFSASGREAFRWTEAAGMSGLGDLPGGAFSSTAFGASSDGSVIVGSGESILGEQAFRWTAEDGMIGLPQLPGGVVPTEAFDASADGSIVVGRARYQEVAFIWDATNGTRALADVLEDVYGLDLTGWTLEEAWGISADGLAIVGMGTNPSGDKEGFVAIIPEPSTGLLVGAGLVGLGLRRYRRADRR